MSSRQKKRQLDFAGKFRENETIMIKKDLFDLHAGICKTLANPKRLEIIYALKEGEKAAGEIVEALGIPKANASQHLSLLRSCGVVRSRRAGVNIYYSISNPKIVSACMLMREVLMEQMDEKKTLLKKLRKPV